MGTNSFPVRRRMTTATTCAWKLPHVPVVETSSREGYSFAIGNSKERLYCSIPPSYICFIQSNFVIDYCVKRISLSGNNSISAAEGFDDRHVIKQPQPQP